METEIKNVKEDFSVDENNTEESQDPPVIAPEELLIKHPLQCTWTLWFYDNDRTKNWEDNQRALINFDTIEDFWSVYNHIKQASELRSGCDYSLFKINVRPMWEDAANRNGGRWLISFDRKQRNDDLDKFWLELMLLMIGEGFEKNSEQICGAVVNVRPKVDKIGLWTADFNRMDVVKDIGLKIKGALGMSQQKIEYQAHKDTATKSGSMVKSRLIL